MQNVVIKKVILGASLIIASTASAQGVPSTLDQKELELLAQEEALLKQVGELGVEAQPAAPAASAPFVSPEKRTQAIQEQPAAQIPAPSKQPPAARRVQAAAKQPASNTSSCNPSELQEAQAKIKKLQADLDESRNRLMISETEVERLALLIDERNRRSGKVVPAARQASFPARITDNAEIHPKAESDMPIATVTSEKAQLRTGPGSDHSPLMTVAQGTRLAIETRSGDWYRVISPTGARAWVSSSVIDFGGARRPDSAARGKALTGSEPDAEDAAFQALTKGAK